MKKLFETLISKIYHCDVKVEIKPFEKTRLKMLRCLLSWYCNRQFCPQCKYSIDGHLCKVCLIMTDIDTEIKKMEGRKCRFQGE